MKYIDIHSHLGFEDYGGDQKEVIKRMQDADVGTIAIGADLASSIQAVKVATENKNVWACIGQHPTHNPNYNPNQDKSEVHHGALGLFSHSENEIRHGVSEREVTHGSLGLTPRSENDIEIHHGVSKFDEKEFEKLIANPKVVAVGECGLEYYKLAGNIEEIKKKQKEDFIKQIKFAIKYDKPLMLHIRDGEVKGEAFTDAYQILKEQCQGSTLTLKGNVHFFTGKLDMAQKFIDLGFTISFVGLITYVRDFDKIIKNVPLTSLQAETDAPFVAPVPHRGERNEPSYVIEVYKKIAEIRGEDPETVRLGLLENAQKLFHIAN